MSSKKEKERERERKRKRRINFIILHVKLDRCNRYGSYADYDSLILKLLLYILLLREHRVRKVDNTHMEIFQKTCKKSSSPKATNVLIDDYCKSRSQFDCHR